MSKKKFKTSVFCVCAECEYNNSDQNCCTLDNLLLSDCMCHTVNEGLQHFWKCKNYKKSNAFEEIEKSLQNFMEKINESY